MTVHFNLLDDTNTEEISVKHLRGLIGEEIAAYLLRKRFNLHVVRPSQLIASLQASFKSQELKSPQFKFLMKYAKTMDFIGTWPSEIDLTSERFRISVLDLFTQNSLTRAIAADKNCVLKGYVIEVKSSATDTQSRPKISSRQMKMMNLAKKMEFGTILVQIVFLPNYLTRARFFSSNGAPLNRSTFHGQT